MSTRTTSQDELDELRQAFESLRADVAALNDSLQQVLQSRTNEAGETGNEGEAVSDLEALRRKVEELRDSSETAARELAQEVEAHPLLSVGVAFGIGYLLARITGAFR